MIAFQSKPAIEGEAVIVFLFEDDLNSKKKFSLDPLFKKEIEALIRSKKFLAGDSELFPLIVEKRLCLCVGLGKERVLTPLKFRQAVRSAITSAYLKKVKTVDIVLSKTTDEMVVGAIEGVMIGGYQWKKYLSKGSAEQKKFYIHCDPKPSYQDAVKICDGVNFTRDLINDNADTVHSLFMEKTARQLIHQRTNVSLKILNEADLKKQGLDLFLAVNQASQYPPKLILVKYSGGQKNDPYVAIIGKGVTFDTGGLNLKPTGYMETMRYDMSGAATVLGVLKNCIDLKIKRNVIFAAAVVENAIGSKAFKPGDVIKSYSEKTVEIGNTDAEGRLILADTLSYVIKNYHPKSVIDLATLTGACVVALGYDLCGLMSNNDTLADHMLESSRESGDRVWRLPLHEELKDHLKSQYADLKSTGLPKGAAGTLSAAEFLRQFVHDTPWVHLDIAGTAFVEGPTRSYYSYGATGFGVRLLTHFLKKL